MDPNASTLFPQNGDSNVSVNQASLVCSVKNRSQKTPAQEAETPAANGAPALTTTELLSAHVEAAGLAHIAKSHQVLVQTTVLAERGELVVTTTVQPFAHAKTDTLVLPAQHHQALVTTTRVKTVVLVLHMVVRSLVLARTDILDQHAQLLQDHAIITLAKMEVLVLHLVMRLLVNARLGGRV